MKNSWIIKLIITFFLLSCLLCCRKEYNKKNGSDSDSNNNNQEYPPTAQIIPNAVTDIDNNKYDAVRIGDQVWMAENLRTTRYANGTSIPLGTTTSTYTAYRYIPGLSNSDEENMANVEHYGYLYNWKAVMGNSSSSSSNPSGVQGICPDGWHVPSDAEWTQLTNYVGSQSQYVCGENSIVKALAATTDWNNSSHVCAIGNIQSENNATGFSALPAGYCVSDYYSHLGEYASFWSATQADGNQAYEKAIFLRISNGSSTFSRRLSEKDCGMSVRCIRNYQEEPPTTTEIVVSSMELSQNPMENGWLNMTMIGSDWEYIAGNAMKIVGTSGSNDSWLISPAINATNYNNLKLSFTHRSLNGTSNRQVYYSTTYQGGFINENEWHSLNLTDFPTIFTTYSTILPAELLSASNLRFAFRYSDNTNSTWLLSAYKISSIIEQ